MEVMLRVLFEYMQVKEAGFKDLCYANTVIATIFSLQHGTCISTYCVVVIFYSVLYFRSLSRLVLTRTVKCSKTARSGHSHPLFSTCQTGLSGGDFRNLY